MNRRDAIVLRAFAAWTVYVWGTRIWNVFDGANSAGFIAVHVALALVSVAFAAAAIVVVRSVRRRATGDRDPVEKDAPVPGRAGSLR